MADFTMTWRPQGGLTVSTATTPAPEFPAIAPVFRYTKQAKLLLKGNPAAVEDKVREWLATHPADADARFLLGAALRRQERNKEARAVLETLAMAQPQMAPAWYELGMTLAALGDKDCARDALLRSLDLDYYEKNVWYALGDLLPFPDSANPAVSGTAPWADEAGDAMRDGRVEEAEQTLRARLAEHPDDPKALKLLAEFELRSGDGAAFEALLERCLELAPDYAAARFRYVSMRFVHRDVRGLFPHIEALLETDPANLLYRTLNALALFWSRDFDGAIAEFESFIDSCTDRPGVWLEYSRALRAAGSGKADEACLRAIGTQPAFVEAWLNLANAKSFQPDANLTDRIRTELERNGLPAEDRAKLHYVQGTAFEIMKHYPESFGNYRASNEVLRMQSGGGAENSDLYLRNAKAFFTADFFRARDGSGYPQAGPVFIVGMPRSGSTLVEQILGSHSAVEALGERTLLQEIGQRLAPDRPEDPRGGYPYSLEQLDAAQLRRIGEEYVNAARERAVLDRPFFTDKLPGNFHHVGLIRLALPNAKIIDVRRHPLDCGFSCYKHYFPAGMPHALDLRDIGRFYANYVALMAHFDAVLPGRVHRVFYENLIQDFEVEVRRLLDYVGLPFEEQCLNFHKNKRLVLTLSAGQVSRPLFSSGIGEWRHYEKWLEPLKRELGPVLTAYPAVPAFASEPGSQTAAVESGSAFVGLRRMSFENPQQSATFSVRSSPR